MNTPGRTLVVMKDQDLSKFKFENVNIDFKSNNGTRFLEFDNVENSKKSFDLLQKKEIKCKYSEYKIFLRFKSPNNDIEELKKLIIDKLTTTFSDLNILNISLFQKDDKYIDCGYLVVDKLNDLNTLIEKNDLEIDGEKLLLFKYNRK